MRALGLDVGLRRIGTALSDPGKIIASSYELIEVPYSEDKWDIVVEAIYKIVKEKEVDTVVFGLPLHLNGDQGDKVILVKFLGGKLQELGVVVLYEDERLTTVTAQRVLIDGDLSRKKRKGKVDGVAAAIILQKYLDKKGRNE